MMKILGVLAALMLDVPIVIYRGFVLSIMWLWFIVPFGAPTIGKAWAIGIAMLISLVVTNPHVAEKDDGKSGLAKLYGKLLGHCLITTFVWGGAALVHSFM